MKVYKFGGASLNGIEQIKETAGIISSLQDEKCLIVISAMGKTTNALEKITDQYFLGEKNMALDLFEELKSTHIEILRSLTKTEFEHGLQQLKAIFTEVEWLLHDKPVRKYDYYYDQIVCCGELLSSTIFCSHLLEKNIESKWLDARDIIRTDNNFREGSLDWAFTGSKIKNSVLPLFRETNVIITQGFIGCTDENESTTLGREGSDYTAAIFANLLPADSVTIWKDVESVMSADPRQFSDAAKLTHLSFTEVIEMAYYGAQVIHPKTIKPLQNKNIPLLVKCFLDPSLPGTIISNEPSGKLPPIIVLKENQALIQFRSKNFSFVEDKPVEQLHKIFKQIRIKPNLTQNAAISLLCCFDDRADKTEALALAAASIFDVHIERGLTLLTVRHYNEETIRKIAGNRKVLLEQRTEQTAQLVLK